MRSIAPERLRAEELYHKYRVRRDRYADAQAGRPPPYALPTTPDAYPF